MPITQDDVAEFNELATPLMNWIKEKCSAEGKAIIDGSTIQLIEDVVIVDIPYDHTTIN